MTVMGGQLQLSCRLQLSLRINREMKGESGYEIGFEWFWE